MILRLEPPVIGAILHPAILRRAALATLFFLAALPAFAAEPSAAYANWTKPWLSRPVTSPSLGGAELKAIVSIVSGEATPDAIAAMTPVERLNLAYHIRVSATEVATNGACRSYFVSNTDTKSTEVRQLTEDDLQKLTEALGRLPEDNSELPPAGKRIVVQTVENGQWRVRVYDGKHLPAEVQSVLTQLANPHDKLL